MTLEAAASLAAGRRSVVHPNSGFVSQLKSHEARLRGLDYSRPASDDDFVRFSDIVHLYEGEGHDPRTGLVWQQNKPVGRMAGDVVEYWHE